MNYIYFVALLASQPFHLTICKSEGGPQLWKVSVNQQDPILSKLKDRDLVDIWSTFDGKTQIVVEPDVNIKVREILLNHNIEYDVIADDMLELIKKEENHLKSTKRRKRSVEQMDWNSYHKLEDIEGYIGWLNATRHDLIKVYSVATTEEGRPLYVVKVSDPNSKYPKRKIWIEGGIHAREWISPAVTTFLLHQVVTSPEFRPLLERIEWYFVPVANPDGYAYTFTGGRARMWRKNRRRISHFLPNRCQGIDLNRNWELKWGVGASSNPCSDTYKGTEPFSEPETKGLRNMMQREGPFDVFITFHSYGQSILYPWGWTLEPPSNKDDLFRLGELFVESVNHASKGKTNYNLGGSADVYGLASGASDDWAYGSLRTPYSYTIELRDNGKHGFLLPENQIIGTVQETTVGVYCMASYLADTGVCARPNNRMDIEPRKDDSDISSDSNRVKFRD